MFSWFSNLSKAQRMAFWACFGGWALDALDIQIYAQAIPALVETWGITKAQAGLAGGISCFPWRWAAGWPAHWPTNGVGCAPCN